MNFIKDRNFKRVFLALALITVAHASVTFALGANDNDRRGPQLPAVCATIQVPAGSRLVARTHALGVQVYKWNGTGWDFVAPEARLYTSHRFTGKVGTHYAGPTWEDDKGSYVIGRRVQGCDPDPTAISWLLLEAVTTDGPGMFDDVTYIQRVNTRGGLKPAAPGSVVGEEARVPYSTEYYFYRDNRR
jgi:hypothetical protein